MAFIILISPKAFDDIDRAIDYYNEQQPGLGSKFLSAIEQEIDSLSINPFHQIRYKDYRMLRINKFPYLLVYYISEDKQSINISAIFHGSQHPGKLPK